jgi:hypothetical protein
MVKLINLIYIISTLEKINCFKNNFILESNKIIRLLKRIEDEI